MRSGARIIAPLLCYVIGFALFLPAAFAVVDEGLYVAQAVAFARGERSLPRTDPITGAVSVEPVSTYPIGTALLQTPFVRIGGWRAAAGASVVALLVTVLVLAKWLRETGADPQFALLFLLYAPVLVLGRIAMSDVPSACVVTLGLWLLWRGRPGGAGMQWMAGAMCGLSLMFRETNVLIVFPFIVGAVLRRDQRWPALVGGVTAGIMIRLASFWWMYGDPFYVRDHGAGFALSVIPSNALLYAIALTVLLPGGLVAVYLYRGPRRAEIIAAVALMFVFYVCYRYSGSQSTRLQQLVLGPRFFIPLVPVMIIACAHAVSPSARAWLSRGGGNLVAGLACVAAFAVHPVIARYTATQASIVKTIYDATPDHSVIVANYSGTQKFLNPVYGARVIAYRESVGTDAMKQIVARNAATFVVLVERNDSDFYRADSMENAAYVGELSQRCRLDPVRDETFGLTHHLRIWRAASC